ncbi:MAG: SpoVG family protein [Planctomycetota bacterium]
MVITEVRIKLMDANHERLLGFCSVTFDDMFVIRDLKIIDGARGCFVAMPSRKLTDRCPECAFKNHLRARFCNHCGLALDEDRALRPLEGKAKLHADIAHPIHGQCRDMIQKAIMKAYAEERERSRQPGYVCRYDEVDAGDFEDVPLEFAGYRVHAAHTAAPAHIKHERTIREFGAGIFERG